MSFDILLNCLAGILCYFKLPFGGDLMSYYAYYKEQRYRMGTSRGEFILYWHDEDNIPKGFNRVDNPDGVVKANKYISSTEADYSYREMIYVIYRGEKFSLFAESDDQFLICGSDPDKSNELGFELKEPFLYEKWIPRNEGCIKFEIKKLPSSSEDDYKGEYLKFRFKEEGYQKGELYTYYNGQRYKVAGEEVDSYQVQWYGDNNLINRSELKRIHKSDTQYTYKEYIMARYKDEDYLINTLSGEQVLIEDSQKQSKWVPKSQIDIWIDRYRISGQYKRHF